MGCNSSQEVKNIVTRKQMLKRINDKQKNYRPEFKSYAQFHKISDKRKSVLLSKCSTMNPNKSILHQKDSYSSFKELELESEEYINYKQNHLNKQIVLLAKVPSKKVQKQNDVLFVDGRLIFLTQNSKTDPQQDVPQLLKTLKQNQISVAQFLSGNRQQILNQLKQKQQATTVERRRRIINQYFNDEINNSKILGD